MKKIVIGFSLFLFFGIINAQTIFDNDSAVIQTFLSSPKDELAKNINATIDSFQEKKSGRDQENDLVS